jgi:hypothetical protein
MWMLRELWNDILGSTTVGVIGVTMIFVFLFSIVGAAIYRIREQHQEEGAHKKSRTHAHLHDQSDVNRFGEEPGEGESHRLVGTKAL